MRDRGVCWDGNRLIRSDGSDRLHLARHHRFHRDRLDHLTRDGAPLAGLNEIRICIRSVGQCVAPTDEIVHIEPVSGTVNTVADASGLLKHALRTNSQVLNGIAHISGDEFPADRQVVAKPSASVDPPN